MKGSWLWGLRERYGVCDFYHLDLDEVAWGCGRAATIRHQDLESRRKNRRLWTLLGELSSFQYVSTYSNTCVGCEDGSVGKDTYNS